jgi:fucose 4-O-acetylase-like acetyltransferase
MSLPFQHEIYCHVSHDPMYVVFTVETTDNYPTYLATTVIKKQCLMWTAFALYKLSPRVILWFDAFLGDSCSLP